MKTRDASGIGAVCARVAFSVVTWAVLAGMGVAQAQTSSCTQAPAVPKPPSSGYLDVTSFGAVPNDQIDDAQAIQNAINAAQDGQWIRFPAGRYIISKSLQVRVPGVTLWSDGATLHGTDPDNRAVMLKADRTRIYGFTLTGNSDVRRSRPESGPISAWGAEVAAGYIRGVVIQNNRIVPASDTPPTSNGSSAAGIFLHRVRDFTVAGNEVRRTLADGIHITGASRNGRVVNNKVYQTGDDMIAVVSYFPQDWWSRHLADPNWLNTELDATRVRDIWIGDNTVSDQYWGRGMTVVGGENITFFRNNISKATAASGILIARENAAGGGSSATSGVYNVLVEGNFVYDVRTTQPGYIPDDPDLRHKVETQRAVDFGGVEMYATMNADDFTAASRANGVAMRAVGIQRVSFNYNEINRTAKQSFRMGADTPSDAIVDIFLQDNRLANWGGGQPDGAYLLMANVKPTCNNFWYVNPKLAACNTAPAGSAPATGATLDCTRFPAP